MAIKTPFLMVSAGLAAPGMLPHGHCWNQVRLKGGAPACAIQRKNNLKGCGISLPSLDVTDEWKRRNDGLKGDGY